MRRMIIAPLVMIAGTLLLLAPCLPAQDSSQVHSRTEEPYLVPQTIFVGDTGRLVVPLGQVFAGVDPFVLNTPDKLPEAADLVIKRIELERRGGSSRLLIDFIPYAPGILSFPDIELGGSASEPLVVTRLEAHVASILTPSRMDLSEPAPPLIIPGTNLLIYGTASLILALLFAVIGGSVWGRRHFGELWERFRRRQLLRSMMKFLRCLEQESDPEKKGDAGYYLTLLSGELRKFLSLFTGINCRSLSAGEFLDLPLGYAAAGETQEPLLSPAFLCGLFRGWDTLRFSGRGVGKTDLFRALKETGEFISVLNRAEREGS